MALLTAATCEESIRHMALLTQLVPVKKVSGIWPC